MVQSRQCVEFDSQTVWQSIETAVDFFPIPTGGKSLLGFLFTDFWDRMNFESLSPFLLLVAPFVAAFFLEALVIFFFKLRSFWTSVGLSFVVNLLSLVVLYIGSLFLSKLGYGFNGLLLPLPLVSAFWWLSVVADGVLLSVFSKRHKQTLYLCSILMNVLSYLFLYLFISYSH